MLSVCVWGVLEYRIKLNSHNYRNAILKCLKTLKNGVAIIMRMIRVTENLQVSPLTRGDPMIS